MNKDFRRRRFDTQSLRWTKPAPPSTPGDHELRGGGVTSAWSRSTSMTASERDRSGRPCRPSAVEDRSADIRSGPSQPRTTDEFTLTLVAAPPDQAALRNRRTGTESTSAPGRRRTTTPSVNVRWPREPSPGIPAASPTAVCCSPSSDWTPPKATTRVRRARDAVSTPAELCQPRPSLSRCRSERPVSRCARPWG